MKNFKYYFLRSLPVIFIVLFVASFIMLADIQNRVDKMNAENTVNEEKESENEEVVNEIEDEEVENLVQNEIVENKVENTVKNEVNNTTNKVTVIEKNQGTITDEEKDELNTDDNKEKAVKLVKDKYDTGSGMIFFCDSVLSTGEFVVAAKSSSSSSISAYYKVNLTTGEVTIMF